MRKEYCCNLSGGVALIVWFTTNGMCAKNKNICTWREQAITEWSRRVISIVACYHGAKLCAHAARDFRSKQCQWRHRKMRLFQSFLVKDIWIFYASQRRHSDVTPSLTITTFSCRRRRFSVERISGRCASAWFGALAWPRRRRVDVAPRRLLPHPRHRSHRLLLAAVGRLESFHVEGFAVARSEDGQIEIGSGSRLSAAGAFHCFAAPLFCAHLRVRCKVFRKVLFSYLLCFNVGTKWFRIFNRFSNILLVFFSFQQSK